MIVDIQVYGILIGLFAWDNKATSRGGGNGGISRTGTPVNY